MNKMNNVADNFVNPEEENKMNNIDIKELVSMGADPAEVEALVELLNEIDQEILINKRKSQKVLKMISGESTETTVDEEELTMEELNEIRSKNEQAVASGFATMLKSFEDEDTDTKVNPEEENEMNNTNNTANFNELWEEITVDQELSLEESVCFDNEWEDERATMSDEEWNYWIEENRRRDEDATEELVVEETVEAETNEDSFDATPLIDKGNALIASTPSLFAYKEAIVLLRDVERDIDTIDSYTTRLSLESIKDGLMNLIVEYEADTNVSGATSKKKQLADKVAGFKEVTAEKVSQAKAAIDNIDEDNEYYQKGVEITEKAKAKYNEVLGNVFNRLKL